MTLPPYCTREDVQTALDYKDSARNNAQIDRSIAAGSRSVDQLTHRRFYPTTGIRYFDWPDQFARSWRIWTNEHEAISVSSIALRGTSTVLDPAAYFLEPVNSGPPYSRIEIDIGIGGGSATFGGSAGYQRSVAVTGLWGYRDEQASVGTVAFALAGNPSATALLASDGSQIGVGSLLIADGERMLVTSRSWADSTATLSVATGALLSNTLLPVSLGSLFNPGESIIIGGENMMVDDVIGNSILVRRAQQGSVLAAHAPGDQILVSRRFTVERGACGTSVVGHSGGVALARQVYPSLVQELAVAEALTSMGQKLSGYGRVIGTGDNQREATGKGIEDMRSQVYAAHGRQMRVQAV